LSSMKTVLQVLLEKRNLHEDVREDCGLVVGEIDRLSAKLSQLLEYAKPTVRSPGRRPAVGGVGAVGLAEQVVALLRHDAERRRVKLDLDRPPEDVRIPGTEGALSDVVSNLVVNAIEAQPAGGRVRVSLRQTDGRFVIEVTDDGPGIPSDLRSRILQPFFTTKPSGTGLGLAIVARRLAEMKGTIAWDSPVNGGRGTKFTVSLPLAD
jgi:signal transduction histidine kinase